MTPAPILEHFHRIFVADKFVLPNIEGKRGNLTYGLIRVASSAPRLIVLDISFPVPVPVIPLNQGQGKILRY